MWERKLTLEWWYFNCWSDGLLFYGESSMKQKRLWVTCNWRTYCLLPKAQPEIYDHKTSCSFLQTSCTVVVGSGFKLGFTVLQNMHLGSVNLKLAQKQKLPSHLADLGFLTRGWSGAWTYRPCDQRSSIPVDHGRIEIFRSGEHEVIAYHKVTKNGTSCSSLGTQIYGVELGLGNPGSG